MSKTLEYEGNILILDEMGYPGLDSLPGPLLAHFMECGDNSHIPPQANSGGTQLFPWAPMTAWRPVEEKCVYILCTHRSVCVMRWYVSFFYPPLVVEQGTTPSRTVDPLQAQKCEEFFKDFMEARFNELIEVLPRCDWSKPCKLW